MKAKPIFIVCMPIDDNVDTSALSNSIAKQFTDYNVLVISAEQYTEIEFKCFYEKDFNDVKFEELKQMVNKKLE